MRSTFARRCTAAPSISGAKLEATEPTTLEEANLALYFVRHHHAPDRCPAGDPVSGEQLLRSLSRENERKHGVDLRGEAVARGEHTVYFMAEATDERHLREFLKPLHEAGSLEVFPASTSPDVVISDSCGPGGAAAALEPEAEYRHAIEAGLVVHGAHPLNAETTISDVVGGVAMPNAHFYIRNHFEIPELDAETYRLRVSGSVENPLTLNLRDVHNLPSKTLMVTLECAGNGRTQFEPPIAGEQWRLGAVSTAEWTGVPLARVLERASVRASAREVLFRGADGADEPFERALTLEHARNPDVLLAYAMNGEPLPKAHGFPLRLIVPGWYAVASVKWLTDIEVIDHAFEGKWQAEKYWFEWLREGKLVREPVRTQRVRALITEPAQGQELPRGEVAVRGVAWSGEANIERVEVSVGGKPVEVARMVGAAKRYSWQWWELLTRLEPGTVTLRARATDAAGNTQPERAEWNRLGYGNNFIHELDVRVT
jgi:DMSO/TMAO reductase YedYZ molybdopterin-dependent catalytic subunit